MPTAFRFSCPIYPIIGDTVPGRSPIDLAASILSCGIPLLQLRLKTTPTGACVDLAREVKKLCVAQGASLIINDRCDIAKLVDADGVHVGQSDLPPATAREILGRDAIIGHSTHDQTQLDDAIADPSIDYIAYGPVFATASKQNPDPVRGLDRLRDAAACCRRPLVAIGGIDHSNVAEVIRSGAETAAIISAITNAEDPKNATQVLLDSAAAPPR